MQSSYRIDHDDRILGCSGDWDSFALANGGEEAVEAKIRGRRLWTWVQDFETASLLAEIFLWSRRHQKTFSTVYRCDSPDRRRLFMMHVNPGPDLVLRVRHTLISDKPCKVSTPTAEIEAGLKTGKIVRIDRHGLSSRDQPEAEMATLRCSICNRVHVGRAWVDPFEHRDPSRVLRISETPHTVCSECRISTLASLTLAEARLP